MSTLHLIHYALLLTPTCWTASLVKPYRMVKTVQMADHALLRRRTAVGIKLLKAFLLLLVLCASDLNPWAWGKRSNSPDGVYSLTQGPLKYISLRVKAVGHRTRIKS